MDPSHAIFSFFAINFVPSYMLALYLVQMEEMGGEAKSTNQPVIQTEMPIELQPPEEYPFLLGA